MDGDRQPQHRTQSSHGDVAIQRQGTRRRWRLSRAWYRGTLRSGERNVDSRPAASTPRGIMHMATLLPNGKVLVAGGEDSSSGVPLMSADLYDPASGTWTATGSMGAARDLARGDVATQRQGAGHRRN